MTIIDTPRLRLRPWSDSDAPALFELARHPRIGMLCGWKPYEHIDDAHEALSTFLAAPDSYAVTLASTGELIGSIALRIDTDTTEDTIADIGYWIGAPYWAMVTRRKLDVPSSTARGSWACRRSS